MGWIEAEWRREAGWSSDERWRGRVRGAREWKREAADSLLQTSFK